MKKLITAATIMGLSAAAFAEVDISGVEISGYIDMSMSAAKNDAGTTSSAGLDGYEIRFESALPQDFSVAAHIAGNGENDIILEQAYLTYSGISNVTIIAGKYLSSLGWEAYHAPDLFQWSYSATLVYPGMHNGVGIKYANDYFEVYGAALSSAWDDTDKDPEEGAFEGNIRYTGLEDFTLFVGAATEDYVTYQQTLLNVWASYVVGDLILAAEINGLSDWTAEDNKGYGWLLMANYMFTEKMGLTLRTSALNVEDAAGTEYIDDMKFTIAPSYCFTDNFCMLAEFNTLEDITGDSTQTVALEAILTF